MGDVAHVRAVAFDLMDTVLTDPFRDALEAASGRPVAELFALRDPDVYPAFERGEIDEETYWDHYRTRGVHIDADRFHRVRRRGLDYVEGMGQLLDELDGVVVRATASNYPVWITELEDSLLHGRFERVVSSWHLGVRKPEEAFYEALLGQLELSASAVAFVDDREPNVESARRLGMPAHLFRDVTALRNWLAGLGLPVGA